MDSYFSVDRSTGTIKVNGEKEVSFGNRRSFAYAEWKWDGTTLRCKNDRYGIYPLFYCDQGDRLTLSPSIDLLLRLTGECKLDDDAVALALRLGCNIADETLFPQIKAVPPSSKLTWAEGKLHIESVSTIGGRCNDISRDDAIDEYARLFSRAVTKSLPESGKIAIPLSGGRDSRHILFELIKQKIVPDRCLTVRRRPGIDDEDIRIARLLCDRLGLRHEIVEQTIGRYEAEYQKNVETGYAVQEHGWFVTLGSFTKGRWENIYDGLAGDVLSAGLFLDEELLGLYRTGNFDLLAESVLGPEGFIPRLLTSRSRKRFSRERASEKLKNELIKHANAPNPIGSFYFWNRTRRCVALSPFRLLRDTPNIITPYLEPELFDFLRLLPAEHFLDHTFHTETIRRAYPEYADIPFEDKTRAKGTDPSNNRIYHCNLLDLSLTPRSEKITNRSFFASRRLASIISPAARESVASYLEIATGLLQIERLGIDLN